MFFINFCELSIHALVSGKYGTEDGGEECDGDDDGFRNPVKSEIACEAYSLTAYSNPLNPDSFPGIRKVPSKSLTMLTMRMFDTFSGRWRRRSSGWASTSSTVERMHAER